LAAITVTLQNLLDQTNDFLQNYSATSIDLGNRIRAINRAIEFVQQRMALPSDRQIFTFNFYEDTAYYNLPDGYSDFNGLYYNNVNPPVTGDANRPPYIWVPEADTNILRSTGQFRFQNRYAFTSNNGENQLLLSGHNLHSSFGVCAFNSLAGLTFSSSISGAAVDNNIFVTGGGSIIFNINAGESESLVTIANTANITNLLNTNAAYRLEVFFPTGVTTSILSNIELRLQSSPGNYYSMTTTTDYLSNAWASNGWSKLGFNLADAGQEGTPVATAVQPIIGFTHAGGFSPITGMRLDALTVVQPDLMDFVYFSSYKGTDTTGTTKKILLDTASDILGFGSFAPDLILPICIKAALILWPQLRADPTFYSIYQTDFKDTIALYGKRYPRTRNPVANPTRLKR
jgi:hypothetical protein